MYKIHMRAIVNFIHQFAKIEHKNYDVNHATNQFSKLKTIPYETL